MSQERIPHPKPREPEKEISLAPPKAATPKREITELDVDEFLSKDAEKFLKENQQKGGE